MDNLQPITIPLINPNETDALLVSLNVQENQRVEAGTLLCVLETTKSTFEMVADKSGFIVGIRFKVGEIVQTNDVLLWLAEEINSKHEVPIESSSVSPRLHSPGISQPALALAREYNLDLSKLPQDRFLTKADIQRYLSEFGIISPDFQNTIDSIPIKGENAILIYGGGGHAKILIDLLRSGNFYTIIGILDDQLKSGTRIMDVPVLGNETLLKPLFNKGILFAVNAIGGIGNIQARIMVNEKISSAGYTLPIIVHKSAIVEPSASLLAGTQILSRAYVGGEAKIGYGVIVSTGAIISHDCILDDYAIISPGAILAGEVKIGTRTLIGMGVTINLKATIGSGVRIGNNATINRDVPANQIIQAGSTWH
jgi:acetyltransferase EpsM